MIAKVWVVLALGAVVVASCVVTVSAVGNMNGDCDQLRDGTGDNCLDEVDDDGTCDSCNDYDWDFLYGETELEPPHQSTCGQG